MYHQELNAAADERSEANSPVVSAQASAEDGAIPPPVTATDYVGIFTQLIDRMPEQAALIGGDWRILAVNEAWAQTVTLNGFSDFRPGANYYQEIAKVAEAGHPPAVAVLRALDEIRQRKRTSFRMVYEGGGGQAGKQFEARIAALTLGEETFLTVTRYDITELVQLRGLRDGYGNSLRKTQEEERRRIGRELHDSGLQLLASLSLSLARLKRMESSGDGKAVIDEMEELLVEAHREFRSLSFLAHPPLLEKLPFVEALRSLVEGFGQRAGLATTFEADELPAALSAEAEHTLYRVVQEAISNVYRHARAHTLEVRLVSRGKALHVVVADDGRGIPEDIRRGVGLSGMHGRMREMRGRLTIVRRSPGTAILASLPRKSESDASEEAATTG